VKYADLRAENERLRDGFQGVAAGGVRHRRRRRVMPSGTIIVSLAGDQTPGTLDLQGGPAMPTLYNRRSVVPTYLTGAA